MHILLCSLVSMVLLSLCDHLFMLFHRLSHKPGIVKYLGQKLWHQLDDFILSSATCLLSDLDKLIYLNLNFSLNQVLMETV